MQEMRLTNVQVTPEGREQIQRMRAALGRFTMTLASRVPLVLTIEGRDGPAPDKLEWISPDGAQTDYAIVDRAQFERLREFTEAALAWEEAGMDPFHPEKQEATKPRLFAARAALLPTDTDPLP